MCLALLCPGPSSQVSLCLLSVVATGGQWDAGEARMRVCIEMCQVDNGTPVKPACPVSVSRFVIALNLAPFCHPAPKLVCLSSSVTSQVDNGTPVKPGRAFAKALAAIATLGTGNSLGPEGPAVELGVACSRMVCAWKELSVDRQRTLLGAGAAAGVAAGFNAPIAVSLGAGYISV